MVEKNINNYKQRCIEYLRKIYGIFETNFLYENFEKYQDVLNPYKTLYPAHNMARTEEYRTQIMLEFAYYDTTSFGKVQSEFLGIVNNNLRKQPDDSEEGDQVGTTDEEISNLPSVNDGYMDDNFADLSDDSGDSKNEGDPANLELTQVRMSPQLEAIHEW